MSDPSHHSKSVLNAAFELSPDNIAVLDHSGRVIDANPALLRYLGATREQLRNGDASSLATHLDLSKVSKAIADAVTQARRFDLELPTTAIDGTIGVQVVNIVPEKNESGGVERVVIYGREFADIGRLKELVASAQDQLHAAIKVLPDIFWIKDLDGRYVLCNDQFDRFNQVAPGSLLGRKTLDLDPHAQIALQIETDRQALASEGVVRFQFEVEPRDGDCRRYYEVKKIAIRDPQGVATGLLGIARDITATQVLEQELKDREREFRQLAENLPDMLVRYDSNAVPIFANDALKEFFKTRLGLSPQGTDTDAIPVEAGLSPVRGIRERVRSVIADGEPQQREFDFETLDGTRVTFEIRLFPEFGPDGRVCSVVGIGRDISERKHAERMLAAKERELERLAFTDTLTGLANRATFSQRLRNDIAGAMASGNRVALLTLDIDRFKSVNDSMGHGIGDELLREVADRLRRVVAPTAWLGRLGGDEFAIIVPMVGGGEEIDALAQHIIASVSRPVDLEGFAVSVSVSVGVSVAPDDSNCEDVLFRYSDLALYRAKSSGKARYCRYTPQMNKFARENFEMEAMIGEGIAQGQFTTHFQPKVDLVTNTVNSAEALCRWIHPSRGFISPNDFIPVAEETGQIVALGRQVLWEAASFAVACNQSRRTPFVVAVNVSAQQFFHGGFLATLGLCLETTGCKAAWLELEITESVLLKEDRAIVETLEAITRLGMRVTIDDFGTGYSSLGYLRRFPIGALKIDRSFVSAMLCDEKQEVLVKAILAMAKGLGLKTVAEGVERAECAARLAELGCDQGQGYLWYRPMPAAAVLEQIVRRGATTAVA